MIETVLHTSQRLHPVDGQVAALREVPTQQSVRVPVGSAQPWACRVGEEHAVLQTLTDVLGMGQLIAPVPRQRLSGHRGQPDERGDERVRTSWCRPCSVMSTRQVLLTCDDTAPIALCLRDHQVIALLPCDARRLAAEIRHRADEIGRSPSTRPPSV